MNSTVVSKIRVYNPNSKGTPKANLEYCKYIATRPGVVITEVDLSSNIEETYLEMSNDSKYVNYIAKRPRSHGLFGNLDTTNLSNISSLIQSNSKKGNLIYRGIISLSESDARELGYFSPEKWKNLMNSSISDIGNVFNIPIHRLQWVAAFHFEQGHPHCHYMFWDAKEKVVSAYIHYTRQQKCREIFSNVIARDERHFDAINKTAKRDLILDYGRDIMLESKKNLSDLFLEEQVPQKIPSRIDSSFVETVSNKLILLTDALPDKGKIAYKYMPPEIKSMVNDITDYLFENKDMEKEYNIFINLTKSIAKSYSVLDDKSEHILENAIQELKHRLGNVILTASKELRNSGIKELSSLKSTNEFNDTSIQNISINEINDESIFIENEPIITSPYDEEYYNYLFNNEDSNLEYNNIAEFEPIETSYDEEYYDYLYNNEESYNFSSELSNDNFNSYNTDSILSNNEQGLNDFKITFSQGKLYYEDILNLVKDYKTLNKTKTPEYISKLSGACRTAIDYFSIKPNDSYFQVTLGKILLIKDSDTFCRDKGIDLLEKALNNKNSDAALSLGKLYYQDALDLVNENRNSNLPKTPEYFSKLSDTCRISIKYFSFKPDDPYFQAALGKTFLIKDSDTFCRKKGIDLLKKALVGENLSAALSLGKLYYQDALDMINENRNSNLPKTPEYFSKLSDSCKTAIEYFSFKLDDSYFQAALGKILLIKDSDTFCRDKGINLLQESLNKKNLSAALSLGKIYYQDALDMINENRNSNLPKTPEYFSKLSDSCKTAIEYFSLKPDDPYFQAALGNTLLIKDSETYRRDKGTDLLKKALDNKNLSAALSLGKLYYQDALDLVNENRNSKHPNTSEYLSKLSDAYKTAIEYFSLKPNDPYFQAALGKTFLIKESNTFCRDKGIDLLQKALNSKNLSAALSLGKLYYQDALDLVNENRNSKHPNTSEYLSKLSDACKTALEYFSLKPNDSYFQAALGKTFLIKESDTFCRDKGIDLLQKALNSKNLSAALSLGKIYYQDALDMINENRNSNLAKTPKYFSKLSDACKTAIEYFSLKPDDPYFQAALGKTLLIKDSSTFCRDKGIDLLEKALNNKNLGAALSLGKIYYQDALDLVNENRNSRHPNTPEYLSKLSDTCKTAIDYFSLKRDDPYFQAALGNTLLIKDSNTYRRDKGTNLLKKALDNKNLSAALSLGKLYYQDALDLINENRNSKYPNTPEYLSKLSDACKTAIDYFSLKPNDPYFQAALGNTLLIKDSNTYRRDKGIDLLKKAFDNKNLSAALSLGKLYYQDALDLVNENRNSKYPNTPEYLSKLSDTCKTSIDYFSLKPNDPYFQAALGKTLLIKDSITFCRDKGVDLLEKALGNKNIGAALSLGKLYYQDALDLINENRNSKYPNTPEYLSKLSDACKTAIDYFSLKPNDPYFQAALGKTLLVEDSNTFCRDKGTALLEKALNNKNLSAAYTLGKYYLNETMKIIYDSSTKKYSYNQIQNINSNCKNALKFLFKAENNEFVKLSIAQTYLIEESNTFNSNEALHILHNLSENKNDVAQYNLGKLYLFGNKNIEANTKLALEWLKKAKENGNESAKTLLHEREKFNIINSTTKGFKMIINIFNDINRTNTYQNDLMNRMERRNLSKQVLKEELKKEGKELHQKDNEG